MKITGTLTEANIATEGLSSVRITTDDAAPQLVIVSMPLKLALEAARLAKQPVTLTLEQSPAAGKTRT